MLIFYVDYVGLNNISLFGLAILIFGIWNAVNDPIFGYISDKKEPHPVKGKRKPLMFKGMPFILIGFLITVLAPVGKSDGVLFTFLLVGLIIFDFGKALAMVNFKSYTMTIASDPQERSELFMVIKLVSFVPGAIVGMVPAWFLTKNYSYGEIITVFISIVIPMFILSCYGISKIEEPEEMYIDDPEFNSTPNIAEDDDFTLRESLRHALRSKAFRIYMFFTLLTGFYQAVYYQNLIYMMNWVVNLEGYHALIIAGIGGTLIHAYYPLLSFLRKKFGNVKTMQFALTISIGGYLLMFFSMSFWSLLVSFSISVISISAVYLLGDVILADIVDEDMLTTGKQRQGVFTSIKGFFMTFSQSIAIFTLSFILDSFGYVGTVDRQPDSVIIGIKITSSIIPIIALSVGLLIWKYYPLRGEAYEELREDVKIFLNENLKKKKNLLVKI